MSNNLYGMFKKAHDAKEKADFYKNEYEKAKDDLIKAMQENGDKKLVYKTGKCTLIPESTSIILDGDAVKKDFPEWAETYGKEKKTGAYLRW